MSNNTRIKSVLFISFALFMHFFITLVNTSRIVSNARNRKLSSIDDDISIWKDSGFTYRTLLFENIDKRQTKLKPDEKSSELRVSREELGRFTW
jgi:hypothetical protein